MSENLKPCPFCGGSAEVEREGTSRQSCIVSCTDCGCKLESNETGYGYYWNCRGVFDAITTDAMTLLARVRELEAEVKRLHKIIERYQRENLSLENENNKLRHGKKAVMHTNGRIVRKDGGK